MSPNVIGGICLSRRVASIVGIEPAGNTPSLLNISVSTVSAPRQLWSLMYLAIRSAMNILKFVKNIGTFACQSSASVWRGVRRWPLENESVRKWLPNASSSSAPLMGCLAWPSRAASMEHVAVVGVVVRSRRPSACRPR